jgi:hypothetical protein
MQLRDGGLGVYYPGFGTLVVWEKVRGLEGAIDQLSSNPPDFS